LIVRKFIQVLKCLQALRGYGTYRNERRRPTKCVSKN
jgi:hypothetical protein